MDREPMGAVMADEETPTETQRSHARDVTAPAKPIRRPFDTSGVDWVPHLKDDDPPYRDWWVVSRDTDERDG